MGTLLDLASLVVVPSGYKEDKIYSVVPTDGSGDLDFTRASSATRVNSAGLIEKVRTNANFNFQAWAKLNGSEVLTSGVTDPFGGTNAFNLSGIVAGNYSYGLTIGTTLSVGASSYFTISLYAKGTGTIAITGQGTGFFTPFYITLTSTWTRYTLTIQPSGAISTFTFYVSNFTGSTATSVDIAFPQAELGDIATDYIPTTSAAVSVGMTADVPRLDYLGSSCPRLILEPQRTNLKTSSENATGWGNPINITTSLNVATSPDGYVNADKIIEAATTSNHRFDVDFSATSGNAYTFSYFAKAAERTQCHIHGYSDNGVFGIATAIFNLSNGTIVSNTGGGAASIVDYGNGWYRVSLTLTAAATAIGYWGFGVALNGATNYLGVVNNGALFYGIQLEVGSYATSYIPTLSTSVTRVADVANKTSISSLIGATEGVMFMDCILPDGANPILMQLSNNTSSFSQSLYIEKVASGNFIRANFYASGALQAALSLSGVTVGQRYKIAAAYKQNDFALYINGVQVGVDTSGTVQAGLQDLQIGHLKGSTGVQDFNGNTVNQALLFPTRLSNTELAQLTTL